jgi:hypothetical protein
MACGLVVKSHLIQLSLHEVSEFRTKLAKRITTVTRTHATPNVHGVGLLHGHACWAGGAGLHGGTRRLPSLL